VLRHLGQGLAEDEPVAARGGPREPSTADAPEVVA
jgi:hypothetical protein